MSGKKGTSKKAKEVAMTPEDRELELVNLAYDEVEKRLRDGTISSQLLSILLKRGSPREDLEMEILERQADHLEAKTKAIETTQNLENILNDAMSALTKYSGHGDDDE